jgi:hypothetical protein
MTSTWQRRRGRQETVMTEIRSMARGRATYLACGAALLWATGVALAADTAPTGRPVPSKEMREQMAAAHEKIAACLRSDKPIDVCRDEMKKMHDSMMHEHYHMGHSSMPGSPQPDTTQK